MAEVSRTYSLANLRMNFPLGKYWRNPPGATKGVIPSGTSSYVSIYLGILSDYYTISCI